MIRLYVCPDHRVEGTSHELLEAACQTLVDKEATRIWAMVLSSNEVGTTFYRKFGDPGGRTEIIVGDDTYSESTYELHADLLQSLTGADARP